MKKNVITLIFLLMCGIIQAQDIKVDKFYLDPTDLTPSTNPIEDNQGVPAAVFKIFLRDVDNTTIEPNYGILKQVKENGQITLWVPQNTKRLNIRSKGREALIDFMLPEKIESKRTYKMWVTMKDIDKNHIFLGLGYNISNVKGPLFELGYEFNHHQVVLGFIYGTNKTKDLFYFYSSKTNEVGMDYVINSLPDAYPKSDFVAGYNFHLLRLQAKYGYRFDIVKNYLSISPMVGIGYNLYYGKPSEGYNSDGAFKNASSMIGLGGLRIVTKYKHVGFQISPEFHFGIVKDNNCKLGTLYDETFNKWTTGFNINAGILLYL